VLVDMNYSRRYRAVKSRILTAAATGWTSNSRLFDLKGEIRGLKFDIISQDSERRPIIRSYLFVGI